MTQTAYGTVRIDIVGPYSIWPRQKRATNHKTAVIASSTGAAWLLLLQCVMPVIA